MKARGFRNHRMAKASRFGGGFNPYNQNQANGMFQPVAHTSENDGTAKYNVIGGVKVLREYGTHGKRNAIHLIISKPQEKLFEFLMSLRINVDEPDYDEVTPFNQLSKDNFVSHAEPMY